jgi:hypothetical protein
MAGLQHLTITTGLQLRLLINGCLKFVLEAMKFGFFKGLEFGFSVEG